MNVRIYSNVALIVSIAFFPALAGASEELVFHPSIEVRPRLEASIIRGNLGAQKGAPNYRTTQRTRAGLRGEMKSFAAYLSIQDVRTWASEDTTLGDFSAGAMDFHEAWLQWGHDAYHVRVGRQVLRIDGERLIGAVNWSQQGRSFDGVRIGMDFDGLPKLTLFGARVPDGGLHHLIVAHTTYDMMGIHFSVPLIVQTNAGVGARERGARLDNWTRFTGGAYIKSTQGPLTWRVEGYVQGGENILAYMAGARVGYQVSDTLAPVLWVDLLSGDTDHTDTQTEAFDTLFATNHKFYGLMDRFLNVPKHTGNGGLLDIALKNTAKFDHGKLHMQAHYYRTAVTNADGFSGSMGLEVDMLYSFQINPIVHMLVGDGLFFDLGDFRTGRKNMLHNWFVVQLAVKV